MAGKGAEKREKVVLIRKFIMAEAMEGLWRAQIGW